MDWRWSVIVGLYCWTLGYLPGIRAGREDEAEKYFTLASELAALCDFPSN